MDASELPLEKYRKVFGDYLEYYVRNTFNSDKRGLLFVTYQPKGIRLNPMDVIEKTKELFGRFAYVEVIEQTYKISNLHKVAGFINGYHSHILIKESDYKTIEDQLKGLDIKAVRIWGLDGIYNYLSKQAGLVHTRILPIQNLPALINESDNVATENIQQPIEDNVKNELERTLVNKGLRVFHATVIKVISGIKKFLIKPFIAVFNIATRRIRINDTS